MEARQFANYKLKLADGSIISVVIWELPSSSNQRPHGLKYRLNFCTADGTTLVRYDNEQGKGDRVHFGDREKPYEYKDVETLLEDF